jgi:ribonuclease HI
VAFNLRLPRFPKGAWDLHELTHTDPRDETKTTAIHHAVAVAWQQQILETWAAIWRWRHNIDRGKQQWTKQMAQAYLSKVLRSSLKGLGDRLPRTRELRDPRRAVLDWLARHFDEEGGQDAPRGSDQDTPRGSGQHIMFFDGGSRGNPGPGGSGAVIVQADQDAVNARVVWSACMSYAQADMTNNRAEYLGAIAGLKEARDRGWKVQVVGDSSLILRQLREYRPPRHRLLRPLYAEARRLADQV